jgi:hypothetical protein
MPQFRGKSAKKSSSDTKRHFTVVIGGKEHGLYVSSTPSSAARKAVTKLCTANKSKKVEFSIREITQGSKKKTYGPYEGYIEKLKEPIELKGRVIKYKPVAKLSGKKSEMKGGMTELEIQKWREKLKQQNQNLNTIISSKKDLEINEKNFIKEYVKLIINQGFQQGFDSLSSSYSATITEERLNQLKNIAKEIRTITVDADTLPSWDEAKKLLENGKVFKFY